MDDDTLAGLHVFAKIAKLSLKAIPCKRVGMAVIGLEVPHAHIHLIPLNKEADILFQSKLTLEKMEEVLKIRKEL